MKFFWIPDKSEHIDYSNLSDGELLDSFKSDRWSLLDVEHRIAVVQEMENRNAAEQGRKPANVVSMDDQQYYGKYNDLNNQLRIDVSNVSSYDTLDTYVHESNHAYQSYCIRRGEGFDESTLSMMQAELARDENGWLYNYEPGKTLEIHNGTYYLVNNPKYDMQCTELDSNNKAAAFLSSQRDRYQNDADYRAYIAERAERFEEINHAIEQSSDQRAAMQGLQAEKAYIRGDISEEQYRVLSQDIADEQYIDSTVQGSKYTGERISALNHELQEDYSFETQEANEYMGSAACEENPFSASSSECEMDSDNSMEPD